MNLNNIRTLTWKEIKELSRDRKLIITTILFPLISLPTIGLLTAMLLQYQPVVIAVINQDPIVDNVKTWFTENLVKNLASRGYAVAELNDVEIALRDVNVDLIVIVPNDFSSNLTSFDKVAYLKVVRRAGVSEERVSRAEQDLRTIVSALSAVISQEKIKTLVNIAGIEVYDTEAIRNPIQIMVPLYVAPTGEPAKPEDIIKPFIARLLILTFAFIVTPASSYIVDGIVGERERKTMEMLLVSPAGLWDLLTSKIIAASIIGLISSLADVAGLLVYFGVLITALGGWFIAVFDPFLIGLHALTAFLSILVTVSIAIPFITRAKGIKTASNIAGLLSMIGLSFFVSGWIIDFYRLPSDIIRILMFVPYTHSVMAIQSYVYGDRFMVFINITILLVLSILTLAISLRTLDREKVLLAS